MQNHSGSLQSSGELICQDYLPWSKRDLVFLYLEQNKQANNKNGIMLPYQQSELLIFTSSAIYNCYFSKDWIAWEWEEKNIYILRCTALATPVHSPCLTLSCRRKAESGAQTANSAPSSLCCTGDRGAEVGTPAPLPWLHLTRWPAPPITSRLGGCSPWVNRISFAPRLVRIGHVPHQANYDQ